MTEPTKNNRVSAFAVHNAKTQIAHDWWVRKGEHLAPERAGNRVTALVDGKETMQAIAESMRKADKYIYITDWGMTPGIHLIRNGALKDEDTLLSILRAAGKKGVQVRVILWDSADKVGGIDNFDIEAEKELEKGEETSWFGIKRIAANPNIRVSRHTPDLLFWTHHQKSVIVDGEVAYLGGIDLCAGRWDEPSHPIVTDPNVHPDIDYYNPCIAKANPQEHPRMPWHDVHLRIEGPAAYDVERSFVQRWNYQKDNNGNEAELAIQAAEPTGKESVGKHKVQIVRSVSGAHIETKNTEQSIYDAYVNAIRGARNFIYIENQYFVSNYGTSDVQNRIVDRLAQKVIEAIDDKRPFKIVIVIPAHPEGMASAFSTKEVMHYQYQTLGFEEETVMERQFDARGEPVMVQRVLRSNTPGGKANGLLNRIVNKLIEVKDPSPWETVFEYVGIYCLRNHGLIGGRAVHEQIYVHTKAMIVDDQIAIVGSANINDRSQLGDRDSELAAVVEDGDRVKTTFNGKPIWVRKFAHDLRKRLWAEHMDLKDGGASVADAFEGFKALREQAKKNTEVYEAVFPNVPSDRLRTMGDFLAAAPVNAAAQSRLNEITGHITLFPIKWLFAQDLHVDGTPATIFVHNETHSSPAEEEVQNA